MKDVGSKSGWLASYWNAFLFKSVISSYLICRIFVAGHPLVILCIIVCLYSSIFRALVRQMKKLEGSAAYVNDESERKAFQTLLRNARAAR